MLQNTADRLERALNTALVGIELENGMESFLTLIDRFYADDAVLDSEFFDGETAGKPQVRERLAQFLLPLHVISEMGGVRVRLRQMPIASDISTRKYAAWLLEVTGFTGNRCEVTWTSMREWRDGLVVTERHFDHKITGGPLTAADLKPNYPSNILIS